MVVLFMYPSFLAAMSEQPKSLLVLYFGKFCAFVVNTFCAVLWHITLKVFVLWYGTFCAFLWHISLKVFWCRAVAHFVPFCGT
jgi:hypothetical protein